MNITFKMLASSVALITALTTSCKKQELNVATQPNEEAFTSGICTSPKPKLGRNTSENNKAKNSKSYIYHQPRTYLKTFQN